METLPGRRSLSVCFQPKHYARATLFIIHRRRRRWCVCSVPSNRAVRTYSDIVYASMFPLALLCRTTHTHTLVHIVCTRTHTNVRHTPHTLILRHRRNFAKIRDKTDQESYKLSTKCQMPSIRVQFFFFFFTNILIQFHVARSNFYTQFSTVSLNEQIYELM